MSVKRYISVRDGMACVQAGEFNGQHHYVLASDYDALQEKYGEESMCSAAISACRDACRQIMGDDVLAFIDDDVARALLTVKEQRDALTARVAELQAAVLKYGWHDDTCNFLLEAIDCDCGLEALRNSLATSGVES